MHQKKDFIKYIILKIILILSILELCLPFYFFNKNKYINLFLKWQIQKQRYNKFYIYSKAILVCKTFCFKMNELEA